MILKTSKKSLEFPICCLLFKNLAEDGITEFEFYKYIPNINQEEEIDDIHFFAENENLFVKGIKLDKILFNYFAPKHQNFKRLLFIGNFLLYENFCVFLKELNLILN